MLDCTVRVQSEIVVAQLRISTFIEGTQIRGRNHFGGTVLLRACSNGIANYSPPLINLSRTQCWTRTLIVMSPNLPSCASQSFVTSTREDGQLCGIVEIEEVGRLVAYLRLQAAHQSQITLPVLLPLDHLLLYSVGSWIL